MAHTRDRSWLGEDSFAREYTALDAPSVFFHDCIARLSERPWHETRYFLTLATAAFSHADEITKLLDENADVWVTLAATGELEAIKGLTHIAQSLRFQPSVLDPKADGTCARRVGVDWARVMEVACRCGHVEIAEWLTTVEEGVRLHVGDKAKWLRVGLERAVYYLTQEQDTTMLNRILSSELLDKMSDDEWATEVKQNISAAIDTIELTASHDAAADAVSVAISQKIQSLSVTDDSTSAATTVFTNAPLMMCIGEFQSCIWTPVKNLIATATETLDLVDTLLHNLGALPRLAIMMGNLEALQAIHLLAQSRPHPRFSFRLAMHMAARFNQLEILKWLHTLPGDEHRCRPDTMAIAARHDNVDVIEWLHQHCPESAITMSSQAIYAAMRHPTSAALLEVCHRCKIHVLSEQTLRDAVRVGHTDAVLFLVDHTDIDIRGQSDLVELAVRNRRDVMVEFLHGRWPETAASMATMCLGDVIDEGGHHMVDLSRRLKLGVFTERALSQAARYGDLDLIKTIKEAHADMSTTDALGTAVYYGRTSVAKWLVESCGEVIQPRHLELAATSRHKDTPIIIPYLVSILGPTSESVRNCAREHFVDLCSRRHAEFAVTLITEYASECQSLIREAMIATIASTARLSILDLLALAEVDGDAVLKLLVYATRTVRIDLLSQLFQSNKVSAARWSQHFVETVVTPSNYGTSAVNTMVEIEIDRYCDRAFALLAQNNHVNALEMMHGRRTREQSIEALRVAGDVTTAIWLLGHEDRFYNKQFVLDASPPALRACIVRWMFQSPTVLDPDAIVQVHVGAVACALLEVEDLVRLAHKGDSHLCEFVAQHHRELVDPNAYDKKGITPHREGVLEFFNSGGLSCRDPPEPAQEVAATMGTDCRVLDEHR